MKVEQGKTPVAFTPVVIMLESPEEVACVREVIGSVLPGNAREWFGVDIDFPIHLYNELAAISRRGGFEGLGAVSLCIKRSKK
jgi:hypothetical protein